MADVEEHVPRPAAGTYATTRCRRVVAYAPAAGLGETEARRGVQTWLDQLHVWLMRTACSNLISVTG